MRKRRVKELVRGERGRQRNRKRWRQRETSVSPPRPSPSSRWHVLNVKLLADSPGYQLLVSILCCSCLTETEGGRSATSRDSVSVCFNHRRTADESPGAPSTLVSDGHITSGYFGDLITSLSEFCGPVNKLMHPRTYRLTNTCLSSPTSEDQPQRPLICATIMCKSQTTF